MDKHQPESGFTVEIVREASGLAALRPEWDALYSRAFRPVPYAAADWIGRCWQRHADTRELRLHAVAVRCGGRLVAVLPLMSRRDVLGFRVLSFIESQTPFYCDILIEDSPAGKEACRHAAKVLAEDPGLLRMRFNAVPDGAAAEHLMRWLRTRRRPDRLVHRIDLHAYADFEDYLRRRSTNLRQEFRRRMRQLARIGEVRIEIASAADDVRAGFLTQMEQKSSKLKLRGERAAWLMAEGTRELFTGAALDGLASGRCSLYLLKIGDLTAASELGFREGSQIWWSKTGYDPGLERYSPGTVMKLLLVQNAMASGAATIDLMFGDYWWKTRLSDREAPVRFFRVWGRLFSPASPLRRHPAPLASEEPDGAAGPGQPPA